MLACFFSAQLLRRLFSLETSASLSSLASDAAFYTFLFARPRPQRHNAIPLKEMELSDWLGVLATTTMRHLVDVVRYKRVQKGRTCSIFTLTVSGIRCKYLSFPSPASRRLLGVIFTHCRRKSRRLKAG